MRITSFVLVSAVVAFAPAAYAQTAPDTENGRYVFNQVSDGMLRLDTRTGQVSLCAKKDTGWACNAVRPKRGPRPDRRPITRRSPAAFGSRPNWSRVFWSVRVSAG